MKNVKWIFSKEAIQSEWYVFKKSFNNKATENIFIDISALGRYILYINDKLVCRGPIKSFDFCKYYDQVEISKFLCKEKNEITLFSCKTDNAGVYVKIYTEEKILCQTDESWKVSRFSALESDTPCICPPLEPVRMKEERFDARIDPMILKTNYDYSNWENAKYISLKNANIKLSEITFNEGATIMPSKIIAVNSYEYKKGRGMRIVAKSRKRNDSTKAFDELYVAELYSEKKLSAPITKNCRVWINGKEIENTAEFVSGKNLIVILYTGLAQPEIFVETEEIVFFEKEYKGKKSVWWMKSLDTTNQYFAWTYPNDMYAGTNTKTLINNTTEMTDIDEVMNLWGEDFCRAEKKECSTDFYLSNRIYYSIKNESCDECLKIALNGESSEVCVKKLPSLMEKNTDFTTIQGNVQLVFDFDVEQVGYIKFKVCADAGTRIGIECFELVEEKGIRYMPENCMTYICRDGWQEYTSFLPRGFRYVTFNVDGSKNPVKIEYVAVENTALFAESPICFECNDHVINDVYKMSMDTVRACMLDTYVDCPGYEQVYWLGDAGVMSHVNLINFGAYKYEFMCLDLIGQSMSEEYKMFYRKDSKEYAENKYMCLPAFGNFVQSDMPVPSFTWAMMVYNYYLYSGNCEGVEILFSYVEKMLKNCERMMSERGLFVPEKAWNLIDWVDNDLLMCGEVTANSAWLAGIYTLFSKVAFDLGKNKLGNEYTEKAKKIKMAINKYCWCDEVGGYVDTVRDEFGYNLYLEFFKKNSIETVDYHTFKKYTRISEQTNTMCYLFDCVDDEKKEKVEKIIRRIEEPDYKHITGAPAANTQKVNSGMYHSFKDIISVGSPYFLYYTFAALSKMGRIKELFEIIKREYSILLDFGTNTCWESFYNEETAEWTRSVCHGWGASPAVYLITDICGIRPIEPGFKRFSFEPNLCGLKKIKAEIPTPYGNILVDIDRDNNKYNLSYPHECICDISKKVEKRVNK